MSNATIRHRNRLHKEIDRKLGKGKGEQLLKGFMNITGNESPEERAKWAHSLSEHLDKNIEEKILMEIREGCACYKTNEKSGFAKKTFPELKNKYPNEKDYLNAVAELLNKRGRCGKKVEVKNGEFISHFYYGDKNKCVCGVIENGWKKPFSSKTWCWCCCGLVKSLYQYVFPDRKCHVDIVETLANGGKDCVFRTWYTKKRKNRIHIRFD